MGGPFNSNSLSGARYVLTFIDDCSRFGWVFVLKEKSVDFLQFKQFKAKVELQFGKPIKALCFDNGGEYISTNFMNFCKDHGT